MKTVTILTGEPTIVPVAEMSIDRTAVTRDMLAWVRAHRPECLPDGEVNFNSLFPHDMLDGAELALSDNELLVELAGRKCYDSFGLKAGKKSNAEYIAHTQAGEIPHASILYHAKMTFFFAGISRRVSHEIIRNYVGADRDEEGAPSQESTRFTHHYGYFVAPPAYLEQPSMLVFFEKAMQSAYDHYVEAVAMNCATFRDRTGKDPSGIDKKRIYEAASSFLPHQAETSFIWTTNPAAIAKFVRERASSAADLEIQRFAQKYRRVCGERWRNLFPQPWMRG